MASQLSNVVGIMDMDGFEVKKQFLCKELGMVRVSKGVGRSVFFNIGVQWNNLSAKDKTMCRYVMQKIHKLPFGVPRGVKSVSIYNWRVLFQVFIQKLSRAKVRFWHIKDGITRETCWET